MSLLNSISNAYKGMEEFHKEMVLDITNDEDRGIELEEVLTEMCDRIAYINILTEEKNVDVELLLQIVAAYLIGREQGEIPEDTPSPATLFEESLFPTLRNGAMEAEVVKEELEDDSGTDTGTNTEVGSEQSTD
jgi:hypothetical protein